ncbi:hypothetical protein GW17_00013156 [Ensete ventricosum]|nr:hypothetical protein GW17_00013156 [Ensete ventricosum]
MGGTYRSNRIPVCGPPAIGRYHQIRSLPARGDAARNERGEATPRGTNEVRRCLVPARDEARCHFPRGEATLPRTGRCVPVRQLTGTQIARYRAILPKSTVNSRLREKEEGEEEEGEEEEEEAEKYSRTLLFPGSPVHRPRDLSPTGNSFSPRGEKE